MDQGDAVARGSGRRGCLGGCRQEVAVVGRSSGYAERHIAKMLSSRADRKWATGLEGGIHLTGACFLIRPTYQRRPRTSTGASTNDSSGRPRRTHRLRLASDWACREHHHPRRLAVGLICDRPAWRGPSPCMQRLAPHVFASTSPKPSFLNL